MFWSVNSHITNDWETAPWSGDVASPAHWSLNFFTTIFYLSKSNQYLGFSTLILTVCEILHTINGLPGGSGVQYPLAMQGPQEMQVGPLGQEDPLEEGMATHASILAWRIPWTEVPAGRQSRVSESRTWLKWLCVHEHTHSKYLPFKKFCWNTANLSCWVSFYCTAKWFNLHVCVCIYVYIYVSCSCPLWLIKGHWKEFPVLYIMTLLLIYFIWRHLHLEILNC